MTPRKPDRRNVEGALVYSIWHAQALDQWAALFMKKLGIDDDRIGASDRKHGVEWRAFFPKGQDGGGNSPGQRLNLDSGIFNDEREIHSYVITCPDPPDGGQISRILQPSHHAVSLARAIISCRCSHPSGVNRKYASGPRVKVDTEYMIPAAASSR
jgi:hypothetical protein